MIQDLINRLRFEANMYHELGQRPGILAARDVGYGMDIAIRRIEATFNSELPPDCHERVKLEQTLRNFDYKTLGITQLRALVQLIGATP